MVIIVIFLSPSESTLSKWKPNEHAKTCFLKSTFLNTLKHPLFEVHFKKGLHVLKVHFSKSIFQRHFFKYLNWYLDFWSHLFPNPTYINTWIFSKISSELMYHDTSWYHREIIWCQFLDVTIASSRKFIDVHIDSYVGTVMKKMC